LSSLAFFFFAAALFFAAVFFFFVAAFFVFVAVVFFTPFAAGFFAAGFFAAGFFAVFGGIVRPCAGAASATANGAAIVARIEFKSSLYVPLLVCTLEWVHTKGRDRSFRQGDLKRPEESFPHPIVVVAVTRRRASPAPISRSHARVIRWSSTSPARTTI